MAVLLQGITHILGGVLQVPIGLLQGTFTGPPVVGTLVGGISGVLAGTLMIGQGVLEVLSSAVPIAKAIVPYLLPFLL